MQVETKKYEELVPSTLNFKTTAGSIEPSKLWVSLSTAAAIIDDVDDNDVNLEPRPSFYPQGDGHVIVIGREGDKPFLYLLNPLAPQSNTFYCSANWRDIVYCSANKIVIVDNEPSHSEIWSYTGHPEQPFTREKKNVSDYAYFYHSQVLARNRHARILKPFNTAIAEKIPPSKGEEGAPQKTSYVVNSVTGKDIYKFPAKWRALGEESPDGYAANHAGLIPLAVQKVGGGGDAKYLGWYSNAERKLIKRKVDTVNTVRVEKMENCRVHGPSFSFSVEREYQIDANKSKGQVFLVASAITGQIKKSAANKETILPQIENAPSQTYYPAPDNMMVFNNTQSSVFQYAKLGTDFKWSSFAYSKKFFYSFEPLNANYVWTMYKDDTKLVLIDTKSGAINYSDFRVLSVQDHINQGWAQRFTLGKDCFGYVTQGEANIHRKYLLLHIFKIEKDNTIRRAHLLEYPIDSTIVASHNTLFNVHVCKEGGVKVKRIHVESPSNFHTDNFTLLADGKHRSLTHVYIISPEALLLHFKLKDSNNFEWVVAHLGKDSKDVKVEDAKQFADFDIIGSSNGYICSTNKSDAKTLHVWSVKDGKTTTVDFGAEGHPELQSVTFIEGYPHIGAVCVKRGNDQEIVLHDFQANKQVARISTGTVSFKAIKHVPERGFLLCSGFEFFTLLNLGKVLP